MLGMGEGLEAPILAGVARNEGVDVHAGLNLLALVERRHALVGVRHYWFVAGLDRLLLVAGADAMQLAGLAGPECSSPWLDLQQRLWGDGALATLETAPTGCCALLPLAWARGLIPAQNAGNASLWLPQVAPRQLWEHCRSESPASGLDDSRARGAQIAARPASALQQQLNAYVQAGRRLQALSKEPMSALAGAVSLLQLERELCRQIEQASWQPVPRPPLELTSWVQAWINAVDAGSIDAQTCETVSDQLVALLHLLPEAEQDECLGSLTDCLQGGLEATDTPALLLWLRLAEGVVGGLNSRRSRWLELGERLRRQGIAAALRLDDPGERGLGLMRLLQAGMLPEQPTWISALAGCLDALVVRIGAASGEQARSEKRLAQQQLEQLIKAGASNLPLLKQLVLALDPDTCYRLPSIQPPSACLVVFKGCLLITTADLRDASRAARLALVAFFERLLPRLWWQGACLTQLLRDLRRFPLEVSWLERESKLLDPLLTLESRGLGPAGAVLVAEPPSGDSPLLQLQLMVLQRLASQEEHRAGLAQRLAMLNPTPMQRLLFQGSELPLLEASTAGLTDRSIALLRVHAQQCGVEELMPLLPAAGSVAQAFRHILNHWRQVFPPACAGTTLPITVVITTYQPNLEQLRMALESLTLQTARPQEVLVVDDGSDPSLAAQLKELLNLMQHAHQLPIRLLRQDSNLGQYACRNIALANCTSEVIAIQDDDDLSHPQRLACQWEALEEGSVAVYCRHLRLDEATAHPQPDGDGLGFWGDGITTLLMRRQAALQLGGFYPVRSRGDVEFRARLRRQFGVAAVKSLEQPLYLMRASSGTVSSDFEYGCSLRLKQWRRLISKDLLV